MSKVVWKKNKRTGHWEWFMDGVMQGAALEREEGMLDAIEAVRDEVRGLSQALGAMRGH